MHSIESRFVIGREKTFVRRRVSTCTFQPGNVTGWGSEGVK